MMKRFAMYALSAVMLLGLGLTAAAETGGSGVTKTAALTAPAASTDKPGKVTAADTARFVGTVEDFAMSDDGKTVLLMTGAVGSSSPAAMKVKLTGDTKVGFDSKNIGNGVFLEVFYSGENKDGTVDAVNINSFGGTEEEMCYNGTVVSIDTDKDGKTGQIVLDPLNKGQSRHAFNFGEGTQIYLDISKVKKGDKLHVLHSRMTTFSLPPQSPAIEIHSYTAPSGAVKQPAAALTPALTDDAVKQPTASQQADGTKPAPKKPGRANTSSQAPRKLT